VIYLSFHTEAYTLYHTVDSHDPELQPFFDADQSSHCFDQAQFAKLAADPLTGRPDRSPRNNVIMQHAQT
jgi:hypothetical protein